MDRNSLIQEIFSMLSDMNDTQLQNIYNYVCDEYAEENHEGNYIEAIQRLAKENTRLQLNA